MRWPEALLAGSLVAAGIINLLPVVGLGSAARLELLYGIPVREPALELLLRHRALLLGLLGTLMIAAAWRPELRAAAILGGLASMIAFLLLALPLSGLGPALQRVALADAAATLLLLVALALRAALGPSTGAPA